MNIVTTRADAQAASLARFFTGNPCPNGHIAARYTVNGKCTACCLARSRKHHESKRNDPEYRLRKLTSARRHDWKRQGILELPPYPAPEFCECCGRPPNGKGCLHLDHDHATGKFRGWLCFDCNRGIGALGDTLAALVRAVAYLTRPRS